MLRAPASNVYPGLHFIMGVLWNIEECIVYVLSIWGAPQPKLATEQTSYSLNKWIASLYLCGDYVGSLRPDLAFTRGLCALFCFFFFCEGFMKGHVRSVQELRQGPMPKPQALNEESLSGAQADVRFGLQFRVTSGILCCLLPVVVEDFCDSSSRS